MTLERLIPTPEQEQAIQQMVLEAGMSGGALNASSMGTGKTLMATEVALRLKAKTVLISAPLHTRDGWTSTILRQAPKAVVRFVENKTKAGKAAMQALRDGDAGFYIIGRELFRLSKWDGVKVDMVVHDEVHSLSQRRTKGFDVAMDLRKRTKYTLCQSGTWFGASFTGAWGVGRIVAPDVVPRAYWKFVADYCATVPDRFDPSGKKVVGERTPGAFAASLPCYINMEAKSTEPPLIQEVYVNLTPRQRRLYDQFEQDGIVWLSENPLVATFPIVQRIRLRQLTLAECSIGDEGEVIFAPGARSSKLDALREMLADMIDEKVLIATDSAKFARLVAAELGPDAYAWTGSESQRDREAAKRRFVHGDLKYIVATQASISEGVDQLQHASHILIELSQNDSPLLNAQMLGRLNRRGQKRRVLVYRVLAKGTLDDEQNESLLMKAIRMRQSMLKDEENAA